MTTLPTALAHHARVIPDQLFTRILKSGSEMASLTFAQAWALASQWAALFAEHGLGPGDPVVLALPNTHHFVGAYYGCLIAGCVPAPVAPPRKLEETDPYLQSIAQRAHFINAKALVVTDDYLPLTTYTSFNFLSVITASHLDPTQTLTIIRSTPSTLGLIQFTSGTSGNPKAVALSQSALVYQAKAIQDSLKLYDRFTEHGISWLPLFHDMGLIGFLLTSGFAGGALTLMQPEDFVLRPTLWLKAITGYKATVTGAPPSAYALCARRVKDADVAGQYDLRSLRVAMVGAEQVTRESLAAFTDKFAPAGFSPRAFMPTYGLAENSLAATMPPLNTTPGFDSIEADSMADGRAVHAAEGGPPANIRQFASVGSPLPQTHIRIVDNDGSQLPERCVGEIALQSPSLMNGYLGIHENPLRDGWLFTGDLGYMADGNLYITGRKKEVIIVGGRNYYPDDVEQVVSTVPGVRIDRAVAIGVIEADRATEKLVVLAETDRTDSAERDTLRLTIRTALIHAGYPIGEVVLLKPKSIQSTLTGKLKRIDCQERYLAGEFVGNLTKSV